MTLAVSDKCIPEWLSISRSLQDWDLVYWEAACLVWSPESCVGAAQCSYARVVHWKVKVTSSLTDVWQQLFGQQDITVIVTFTPVCMKTTPVHQCLETPTETDVQHAFSETASDWKVVSNQQSFIDQATNQWQDCFNACLKAKSKHRTFAILFLRNCHDFTRPDSL